MCCWNVSDVFRTRKKMNQLTVKLMNPFQSGIRILPFWEDATFAAIDFLMGFTPHNTTIPSLLVTFLVFLQKQGIDILALCELYAVQCTLPPSSYQKRKEKKKKKKVINTREHLSSSIGWSSSLAFSFSAKDAPEGPGSLFNNNVFF